MDGASVRQGGGTRQVDDLEASASSRGRLHDVEVYASSKVGLRNRRPELANHSSTSG